MISINIFYISILSQKIYKRLINIIVISHMDIDKLIQDLQQGRCLSQKTLLLVCEKAKEILLQESNVQPVYSPAIVCGNIHGQLYDLLQLFRVGGPIQNSNYVFLGDYVDKGINSVQTFEYLLCLKIKYPQKLTLLRGHHEQKNTAKLNGLYDEIYRKYGNYNPWIYFTDIFLYLPITAIIDNSIFCVHGGLSPAITTTDSIRTIDRKGQFQFQNIICDLLWSDPDNTLKWGLNPRGPGWLFGSQAAKDFCYINDLKLIARSHQLAHNGYVQWFQDKNVVTIWSAPNFVFRCGNTAAIMEVQQDGTNIFKIFKQVPQTQTSLDKNTKFPYFVGLFIYSNQKSIFYI